MSVRPRRHQRGTRPARRRAACVVTQKTWPAETSQSPTSRRGVRSNTKNLVVRPVLNEGRVAPHSLMANLDVARLLGGHPLVLAADLVAAAMSRLAVGHRLRRVAALTLMARRGRSRGRWRGWPTPAEFASPSQDPDDLWLQWVSIHHRARWPTRASTAATPRAASGIGRRAGESNDRLTHVRAAAGGALDPIEGNSAKDRV
jgi:hypothetical protein